MSKKDIKPISRNAFGLLEHRSSIFDAEVPASYKDDLEEPRLWEHVQGLSVGDEVRVIADDMSFMGKGICTYVQGSLKRIKMIDMYDLDEVDDLDVEGDLIPKYRGRAKWSVISKSTGEVLIEKLDQQSDAVAWIEDHRKALAA